MDDFSWGNTRLVIGEGSNKKVIMNEDEKFDESMIPLKKFSEYEAEAWETGSRRSDDTGYSSKPHSRARSFAPAPRSRDASPHPYQQASHSGDYYRDTNIMNRSNPNLRHLGSNSQLSHTNASQRNTGVPQLPLMPFGGGTGSIAGSEYGGHAPMPMAAPGYTGSMYGMMPTVPMIPQMTGLSMYGGSFGGSQAGVPVGIPPSIPPLGGISQQRPTSTFSFATSVNPFAGPSMSTNPTDDELYSALRNYLSTQDLMTVTKK